MKNEFVHLHLHSDYSLLDGACRISELVKKIHNLGMRSCALTDHGNLFGSIEFYQAALAAGVKPILGMEAYVAPRDRRDRKDVKGVKESAHHLTLLVANEKGYRNLVRLSSMAYQEGFYYKPRMDKEILAEYHEGLIALSGCPHSEFAHALKSDQSDKALKAADDYKQIFGADRFYLEIQNHGMSDEKKIAEGAAEIAKKLGLKIVGTNDVHYLSKEDARAHDALLAISTGALVSDPDRLRYSTPEFFIKSPDEMAEALAAVPDAARNTLEVAEKCNLELQFGAIHLPKFELPSGENTHIEYMRKLCLAGALERFGDPLPRAVQERLDYEISVIDKMGFASYFLIVWDLRRFARANGVRVGPGRGSAAGSLVGYVLGITSIDPLRYDLIFERFLNPSRKEMPDIDLDFSNEDRGKVIEYIRKRYGHEHVAQIITFGTMKARAVVRDVGRVLGIDLRTIDGIAKKIPKSLDITLETAVQQEPELAKEIESNPVNQDLWAISRRLEGLSRHSSKHASGVVIGDRPLVELVPIAKMGEDEMTQYDMNGLMKLGLLKIDILGLETLTVLDRATKLVKKVRAIDVDLEKIPLDDKKTYEMLAKGTVKGVFQLETSRGMKELVQKMKPDRIEDLIATIALFRPGPLQSGMVETYINCKHGREKSKYLHPQLEPILKETNGVILYQEQVMRIANVMAGFSMADADGLRKAMGKKIPEIMAKYKDQFVKGATKNGVGQELAVEIFDLMAYFAGYGFNKCLVGSTVIMNAITGERTTIESLFRRRRPFSLHALDENERLNPRRVLDVVANGRKHVFEVRTAQGHRVTATANHAFRTLDGWTLLHNLRRGHRIAAPRRLSMPEGASWPKHELVVLAGLLSEGNVCHPTCLYFFNKQKDQIVDFVRAVERFPDTAARVDSRRRVMEVCVSTGRDARFRKGQRPWNAPREEGNLALKEAPARSGAFRWAGALGILGLKAPEKKIPEAVFGLCDEDVAIFLGRIWSGDGFIANSNLNVPFYATSSRELARGIQTLLLRLGIVSGLHEKSFRYRGGRKPGYTVHIVGSDSIETFLLRIIPHCVGRDAAINRLRRHLQSTERGKTSKDTVPSDVRRWVNEERLGADLTWKQLEAGSDVCMKEFYGRGSEKKRGFRRFTIARLARFFRSRRLEAVSNSDIFWDKIVSIEPKGVEPTYDLTIEKDHNFVADGLVVHNSHSAAYGIVSYQTAYLKANYPVEYMSALMSCAMGNTDKMAEYIEECRQLGIEVQPPDVNESDLDFAVAEGRIRIGLGAVKNVGEKAIEHILAARRKSGRFKSLYQFCENVDLRAVDKKTVDALVKAGAFDSLGFHRSQLMEVLEPALRIGNLRQQDKKLGQLTFFASAEAGADYPRIPDAPEWPQEQLLAYEKEALGFYATSNPVVRYEDLIRAYSTASVDHLPEMEDGAEVTIGGIIHQIRSMITKSGKNQGQKFVTFKFSDLTGTAEAVCFAGDFERNREHLYEDSLVFVTGRVSFRQDTPSIRVSHVIPMMKARETLTASVHLRVDTALTDDLIGSVKRVLAAHPGQCPVMLDVVTAGGRSVIVALPNDCFASPSEAFVADIEEVLGTGHVRFKGKSGAGQGSRVANRNE